MSFYPRAPADIRVYHRGALPWHGFIAQCQVAANPPQHVPADTPATKYERKKQAQRAEHKRRIVTLVALEPLSAGGLSTYMGISSSSILQYCNDLVRANVLYYTEGARREKLFGVKGGVK